MNAQFTNLKISADSQQPAPRLLSVPICFENATGSLFNLSTHTTKVLPLPLHPPNLLQGCASAVPLRWPAAVRPVCQSTSRRLCFRIETAGARDSRMNDAAAASASSAHLTPREMRALRLRTPSFTHVEQFEASAARRRRISIPRRIGALAYPVATAVVISVGSTVSIVVIASVELAAVRPLRSLPRPSRAHVTRS